MLSSRETVTGLEYKISLHPSEEFGVAALEVVSAGISQEDMREVTPEELAESYMSIAVIDTRREEQPVVGFARQVQRDFVSLEDRDDIVIGEIGSVWVNPDYRGKAIGSLLIQHMTSMMTLVGFVPVAICNEYSRKNFENHGYTPVGELPRALNGRQRVVEMADVTDVLRYRLGDYNANEVRAMIQGLPRFAEMVHIDDQGDRTDR